MAHVRRVGRVYRVEVKRTFRGEQLRWSRYTRPEQDKNDADGIGVDAERDLDAGRHPSDRYAEAPVAVAHGMTVGEWIGIWRTDRGLTAKANSNQRSYIDVHIIPGVGHLPLATLTRMQVQRWVYQLERDLMPRSARTVYQILVTAIKDAIDEPTAPIDANPCTRIAVEKPDPTGREALTPAQVAAIVRHAEKEYREAIVALPFTGMRAQELCKRDRTNLTLRKTIEIEGKPIEPAPGAVVQEGETPKRPARGKRGRTKAPATKSPAGARSIVLGTLHAASLSAYLSTHGGDAMFLTPRKTRLAYHNLERALGRAVAAAVKAGEDVPDDVTCQWMRITYRNLLDDAGVPEVAIKAQMGHAARGVFGAYARVTPAMQKRVREALDAAWCEVFGLARPGDVETG